jgi:RNA polymerase sigma-70 factor (ECF subfamily)
LESLQNDPDFTDNQAILDEDYELAFQHIKLIIEQMPPRRREIFTKSKLEGKSSKIIAAELNISAGTVDNQVSEALRFIRSRLNAENIALLLFAVLYVY